MQRNAALIGAPMARQAGSAVAPLNRLFGLADSATLQQPRIALHRNRIGLPTLACVCVGPGGSASFTAQLRDAARRNVQKAERFNEFKCATFPSFASCQCHQAP
jgi:hypothetical protein